MPGQLRLSAQKEKGLAMSESISAQRQRTGAVLAGSGNATTQRTSRHGSGPGRTDRPPSRGGILFLAKVSTSRGAPPATLRGALSETTNRGRGGYVRSSPTKKTCGAGGQPKRYGRMVTVRRPRRGLGTFKKFLRVRNISNNFGMQHTDVAQSRIIVGCKSKRNHRALKLSAQRQSACLAAGCFMQRIYALE